MPPLFSIARKIGTTKAVRNDFVGNSRKIFLIPIVIAPTRAHTL
jgi:hypothetical protein